MYKSGEVYTGAIIALVQFPEGKLFKPFENRNNIYVEKPVWDGGNFNILTVDFEKCLIEIFNYFPLENKLEKIAEISLTEIEDCYNLFLENSPLALYRQRNNNNFEIIWPEKKVIEIEEAESFNYRDNDDLYFSQWIDEPTYYNNIIIRDINTGKIKEKFKGIIKKMPNGEFWIH